MHSIFKRLTRLAEVSLPTATAMHVEAVVHWLDGERELRLLKLLCDPARVSLDVGAAEGVYAYFMRKHSRRCVAFEPNQSSAEALVKRQPGLSIETCALSDHSGEAPLTVPVVSGIGYSGFGTIEPNNELSSKGFEETRVQTVALRTLDSFDFDPVGLIKIDVEGHEVSVLRGAAETIGRSRPRLIVESEDRHNPGVVEVLFRLMADWDYAGFFYDGSHWRSLRDFRSADHQDPANLGTGGHRPYVGNFVFLPADEASQLFAEFG